ncbi:MAG: SAM-dependent methyltransferase, partial [Verrucomicrobia bacterium]|nr:SAM-dependent methyltransferase [Verrucomicrobiota bacterium]
MSKKVNVWFVGAGPGHPGLMTVRGRDILSRADVVLYDRLVNPGILTWAPSWAKLIDSGKTPGGEQMEQQEIHRLLVRYARKGMRVVRLKGGDPFVFGRGGEEAEFLTKAKIAYEVVPGVTAGIAGPAFAG